VRKREPAVRRSGSGAAIVDASPLADADAPLDSNVGVTCGSHSQRLSPPRKLQRRAPSPHAAVRRKRSNIGWWRVMIFDAARSHG
jgi:hypothetical protein